MSAYIPSVVHETDFKKYLTGLLEGDVRVIKAVIDDLLKEDMPLNSIYRDFIQRSMYKVGVLWERNQIPVSIEHLAATATQVVVSDLYLKLQSAKENCPEVIIACVPNEQHDIGTMIVANVCSVAGWKTDLLGANTPTRDLLTYIDQRKRMPDLLALSITLPANRVLLEGDLATITAKFPHLNILVGGQALEGNENAILFVEELLAKYPVVHHVQTLDELEHYLITFATAA